MNLIERWILYISCSQILYSDAKNLDFLDVFILHALNSFEPGVLFMGHRQTV